MNSDLWVELLPNSATEIDIRPIGVRIATDTALELLIACTFCFILCKFNPRKPRKK